MDFFIVPTLTFSVLYCFFVTSHDRRRILHCNVTRAPDEHLDRAAALFALFHRPLDLQHWVSFTANRRRLWLGGTSSILPGCNTHNSFECFAKGGIGIVAD